MATNCGTTLPTGRQVRQLAEAALSQYALVPQELRVLSRGHNLTLRIDAIQQGSPGPSRRYVLKVQPVPEETPTNAADQVHSEMLWLESLCELTQLLVPAPVRTTTGALTATLEANGQRPAYLCRITRWVPGRQLAKGLKPIHFHRLGVLMAQMHKHAQTFVPPPGFIRRRYDPAALHEQLAIIHQATIDGRLPKDYAQTLQQAADRATQAMDDLGYGHDVFGLIHADLGVGGNVIFNGGQAGAVDFEVCGFGHYLGDMAEALWGIQHVPHFPQLRAALLTGYRTARRLADEHEHLIGTFIGVSAVMTIGFVLQQRRPDLLHLAEHFIRHLRKGETGLRSER